MDAFSQMLLMSLSRNCNENVEYYLSLSPPLNLRVDLWCMSDVSATVKIARLILNAEIAQIYQNAATVELDIKKFKGKIALLTC